MVSKWENPQKMAKSSPYNFLCIKLFSWGFWLLLILILVASYCFWFRNPVITSCSIKPYASICKMGHSPHQLVIAGFLNHQQEVQPHINAGLYRNCVGCCKSTYSWLLYIRCCKQTIQKIGEFQIPMVRPARNQAVQWLHFVANLPHPSMKYRQQT